MRREIVLNLTAEEVATLWQGLDVWKRTMKEYDFAPEFIRKQEKNIAVIKDEISK